MSPTADPGGAHAPATLTTQFLYALLSGSDTWDIQICMKGNQVENICERLADEYHKQQPMSNQTLLHNRFKALKLAMLRLPMTEATDFKAADIYADLILTSIQGVFKSLLRPSNPDLAPTKELIVDIVSNFLRTKMEKEGDMTQLVTNLTKNKNQVDFHVDPTILQAHQNLIQWTCALACHLMASIPEFKHRKGPGMTLVSNNSILNTLREMLLVIRLWSRITPSVRPTFTQTTEDYDLVHRLFYLVTKYKENPSDESIHEECLLLPTKVLLPRVHTVIPPRGIAPLIVGLNQTSIRMEYGCEPDSELHLRTGIDMHRLEMPMGGGGGGELSLGPGGVSGQAPSGGGVRNQSRDWVFVEGDMNSGDRGQLVDCVRQMYVGRHPPSLKGCTRCFGVTAPNPKTKTRNALQGWENRWLTHCICGGHWKVTPYEKLDCI